MICFVTNEISPGRRGGIGFYVEEAMSALEHDGMGTCLLVSNPQIDRRRTEQHLRSVGISAPVFAAVDYARGELPEVVPEEAFQNPTYAMSYAVSRALGDICNRMSVELIEFTDYGGHGFVPIRRKRLVGDFSGQVLAVRVHGTAEVIRSSEDRRHSLQTALVEYFAERYAVKHADVLIASTPSMLEDYNRLYGRQGPGVVSPLPVRKLTEKPLSFRPPKRPPCKVFCVGTCLRHKGPEIFIEAAVRLIEEGLKDVQFVLMGRDMPTSIRYGSQEEELKRLVPDEMKSHFEFRCTAYGPKQLLEAAQTCSFVVLPARWEAFCLVAHELRWLGVPLVLSPIPPFKDCFEEGKDAAFTDGTVQELADVMARLLSGELTLTGREDVASLYVDRSSFADVYRRQISQRQPGASTFAAKAAARNDSPLVSVIVVSGEGDESLGATVQSVLASSYENLEVLVVRTGPEAGAKAGPITGDADGRVKSIGRCLNDRAAANNVAIERAAGDFICCLKAGRTISERYIESAVAALKRNPEAAFVSCFSGIRADETDHLVGVETPYGLDPVLVTLEDRTGLGNAVMRAEALRQYGVRYMDGLFAYEDWELGWSMAERGLAGEVLPEIHVFCDKRLEERTRPQKWIEQYHLLQKMAAAHPELVRAHPAEILKAHIKAEAATDKFLTDTWLLQNYRGLRLIRVGLTKCIQEGPRTILSHAWQKVRQEAAVLRRGFSARWRGRSKGAPP
jgi:glycosyltransferase involved in cell wall biosynthesis